MRETFAADHTLEGFHFRMSTDMLVEASFLCERLRAEGTLVGTNPGVHTHMLLQTPLLRKSLVADRTLMGFHLHMKDAIMLFLVGT